MLCTAVLPLVIDLLPKEKVCCVIRLGATTSQAQRRRRQLRRQRPTAQFPWRAYEGVRAALGGHQQQGLDLLGRAGLIPGSTLAAYRCVHACCLHALLLSAARVEQAVSVMTSALRRYLLKM